MAQIQVVSNPGRSNVSELPDNLKLLNHDFIVSSLDEVTPQSCDLVIVDARDEALWARDACHHLASMAQIVTAVVLVSEAELVGVSPTWGIDGFVLDTASAAEWEARIRFARDVHQANAVIITGPFIIDENAFTVTVDGRTLNLTFIEFELLKYLAMHPARVLGRDRLLADVWGKGYYGGTRTVDVHIRRLRAKLGPEYDGFIGTVRNVGYRFNPDH